jgi:hypothetical protein
MSRSLEKYSLSQQAVYDSSSLDSQLSDLIYLKAGLLEVLA